MPQDKTYQDATGQTLPRCPRTKLTKIPQDKAGRHNCRRVPHKKRVVVEEPQEERGEEDGDHEADERRHKAKVLVQDECAQSHGENGASQMGNDEFVELLRAPGQRPVDQNAGHDSNLHTSRGVTAKHHQVRTKMFSHTR